MTYKGHVEKGVIVLDEPAKLPEGAAVEVQPAPQTKQQHEREADVPTLYERLKPFIGMVKDGPPDASVNYEHHLYGLPKQKWTAPLLTRRSTSPALTADQHFQQAGFTVLLHA